MSAEFPPCLFSVGHSNHALETFLDLLRAHRVELLVDVRSQPVSSYTPYFNGRELRAAVRGAGIDYLFLGRELGGRPESYRFYDDDGRVLYGEVAKTPEFLAGIDRLQSEAAARRAAMMCSEEDPNGCHRRLLVARVLAARGVRVVHIRGDGRLESEDDLAAQQKKAKGRNQRTLFDVVEEEPWKSIRSVLPKQRPQTSSTD
jgi:uncharacterized protein (DUF488 family)